MRAALCESVWYEWCKEEVDVVVSRLLQVRHEAQAGGDDDGRRWTRDRRAREHLFCCSDFLQHLIYSLSRHIPAAFHISKTAEDTTPSVVPRSNHHAIAIKLECHRSIENLPTFRGRFNAKLTTSQCHSLYHHGVSTFTASKSPSLF